MNCKPGDLARIVRPFRAENLGKFFRCVELVPNFESVCRDGSMESGPHWLVDPPFVAWDGSTQRVCPDSRLRPIRDQDGEDETLAWKPVPLPQIEGQTA